MSYQEQTTRDQTVAPIRDDRLATHDLIETLAADGNFELFVAALKTAGLEGHLRGPDLSTLFAPSDQAWDRIGAADPNKLGDIVRHHVAPGARTIADLRKSDTVPTLEGTPLTVRVNDGQIEVDGQRLVRTDIPCTTGVIHTLETVLLVE